MSGSNGKVRITKATKDDEALLQKFHRRTRMQPKDFIGQESSFVSIARLGGEVIQAIAAVWHSFKRRWEFHNLYLVEFDKNCTEEMIFDLVKDVYATAQHLHAGRVTTTIWRLHRKNMNAYQKLNFEFQYADYEGLMFYTKRVGETRKHEEEARSRNNNKEFPGRANFTRGSQGPSYVGSFLGH